jgi:ubiquinone/menaquinone biosynthesis C-methylase UbiE
MRDVPRADYGIDAPVAVRGSVGAGNVVFVLAGAVYRALDMTHPRIARGALGLGAAAGLSLLATAGIMVWGSKVGKLHARDRLLDAIDLRGDERALDVGCGRGLLLIGMAKRLTSGRAIGIDLWRDTDQSDNRPQQTWKNAQAEGVADRIELRTGDARQLPFADETFDIVVSSWVLHNLENAAERERALREMMRVLRPGGRVAILDIEHTAEYKRVLRDSGMSDVQRAGRSFLFVVPSFSVTAQKPLATKHVVT